MLQTQIILNSPDYTDIDVVKKCRKHPDFKAQLMRLQKDYNQALQYALYTSLDKEESMRIYSLHETNGHIFVNVFGFRYNNDNSASVERFGLLFMKIMDALLRNQPKTPYSVVYYHSLCQSDALYTYIRDLYKRLPLMYYVVLRNIYVIEPTFLMSRTVGLFDFSKLTKILERRFVFISKLVDFFALPEIRQARLIDILDPLLMSDPQLKMLQINGQNLVYQIQPNISSTQNNKNIQKQAHNNSSSKLSGEAQQHPAIAMLTSMSLPSPPLQPTKASTSPLCMNLNQHRLTSNGLPIMLVSIVETFKANPSQMLLEGIFRKGGSYQQQQDIIKRLLPLKAVEMLTDPTAGPYNGYSLAAVIKKIFNLLVTPIAPYQVYSKLLILMAKPVPKEDQVFYWFFGVCGVKWRE